MNTTTKTVANLEGRVVSWIKMMFNFFYNPIIRNLTVAGLLACSVAGFIGYTMLTAQVDSAKAQVDITHAKAVLNADATVTGQVFLLFGVVAFVLAICVCGLDLIVYVVCRFSKNSELNDYRNHKDWKASLNETELTQFNKWWGVVKSQRQTGPVDDQ
jgi:hypothetical protein